MLQLTRTTSAARKTWMPREGEVPAAGAGVSTRGMTAES